MSSKRVFSTLTVSALLVGCIGGDVSAFSDSITVKIPKIKGHSIQSNAWMSPTNQWQVQEYKVSAKFFNGKNPAKAQWIKTSWGITATGVNVSIGGISGGTAKGNELTGHWINKNTWISDYAGSYKVKGLALTGGLENTASFLAKGEKRSATASVWRGY